MIDSAIRLPMRLGVHACRMSWIEQAIVCSTGPPVCGLIYSNATSSKGLAPEVANCRNASSVRSHS
jgi:hypothetical protein